MTARRANSRIFTRRILSLMVMLLATASRSSAGAADLLSDPVIKYGSHQKVWRYGRHQAPGHYSGHQGRYQAPGHDASTGVGRRRCPRQVSCGPPSNYHNPCCLAPPWPVPPLPPLPPYPPIQPLPTWPPTHHPYPSTPPHTWIPTHPPTQPTHPPTQPTHPPTQPTHPPTRPPTYPPTYPPTTPPTYPPTIPSVTPVYDLPPWCGMYGQCGCPLVTRPPVCPYMTAPGSKRLKRHAQRSCKLDGQCPSGSSCCTHACHNTKICTPVSSTSTPIPRPRKVKVSVIMTSGCSDSHTFFKKYLVPFTSALEDHLELDLIPYGKVNQNGGCQFGQGDCLGNWLVSCGIRHLRGGQVAHLAFTTCLTHHTHILASTNFTAIIAVAAQCTGGAPEVVEQVYRCAVTVEGYSLFQEAGRRQQQLAPSLTSVPTVALDGEVVIRGSGEMKYLPKLLCERLKEVASAQIYCQRALTVLQ
nr:endosialin-like [Cherax quadricarinatus]